ncbi:unnamed protein product [Nezara viridula]|uniref:Uncharacterized protein n=1 Tax=Nezara viridula TaxID=85310 RepID=A0A9P0HVC6_NEZVI|nr:unnamed protein product [Nezara viridula]
MDNYLRHWREVAQGVVSCVRRTISEWAMDGFIYRVSREKRVIGVFKSSKRVHINNRPTGNSNFVFFFKCQVFNALKRKTINICSPSSVN